jgi:hypothetical protein
MQTKTHAKFPLWAEGNPLCIAWVWLGSMQRSLEDDNDSKLSSVQLSGLISWLIGRDLLTTKYNNIMTFRKVTSTSCFEEGSIGSTCVPLCSWHRSYSLVARRSISAAHRIRWRLAGGRHNYVTPQEYISEMSTGPAGSGRTRSNRASQTSQKAATTGPKG